MIIGWGIAKVLGELFERAGPSLTREGFIYSTERARNVKTGVYPPVGFSPPDHLVSPTDHLGGSQVHLMKHSAVAKGGRQSLAHDPVLRERLLGEADRAES